MSATMTFLSYRTANPTTTYPEEIPSALQTAINNWYDTRIICDDDNFGRFFQRVLTRDYPQYNQLLRIEPGVAQYDWMVEEYLELQRGRSESEGNSVSESTSSTSSESSGREQLTGAYSKTGQERTRFNSTGNSEYTSESQSSSESTEASESTSGSTSESETIQKQGHGGNDKETVSETSGEIRKAHSQSASENYDLDESIKTGNSNKGNIHSGKTTPSTTTTTTDLTKQGSMTVSKELAKSAPMSISYGSEDGSAGASEADGMPALNWQYPSSQGGASQIVTPVGTEGNVNTVTHTGSDLSSTSESESESYYESESNRKSYNRSELDTENYDSYCIKNSESETSSTSESDISSKHGINGEIRKETGSKASLEVHTQNYNAESSESESELYSESISDSSSLSETAYNDAMGGSTRSQSEGREAYSLEREQHSGRHGEPAEIMARAAEFIKGSSAWAWLNKRLEPCFLGTYDI